jgi:hypothetical protein
VLLDPLLALPKPMIRPPLVLVWNQASSVTVFGAAAAVCVDAVADELPLRVKAVLASPVRAPLTPLVTPLPTVIGAPPMLSAAVDPVFSPSRHWFVAPSVRTASP